MANVICRRNLARVFGPSQLGSSRRLLPISGKTSFGRRVLAPEVRAASSSSAFVETKPPSPTPPPPAASTVDKEKLSSNQNVLACPVCYKPLTFTGDLVLSVGVARICKMVRPMNVFFAVFIPSCFCCRDSASGSALQCGTCSLQWHCLVGFAINNGRSGHVSLIEFCIRTPLVSYLYERGWRQNLASLAGFPGPEKEFELTMGFLKPVLGGNVVDASCGSGLFSRLFAESGFFSVVVALDYSDNMLKQCYEFIRGEENFPKE
ncbi:uncharacterized methyltransferase At1g78140, chloroplastic-like [Syzygium oleosum]|uniref:uncharacterized methyltransferase At1g78140, chloroplastic-like n=1 Tax=Syzygium oleosum TaxID=219896 RepID=UPI0024BAC69E|nr:uncharacterized methyltransferase At1g78140, chloroplastic-like [Syzygium oleosum]